MTAEFPVPCENKHMRKTEIFNRLEMALNYCEFGVPSTRISAFPAVDFPWPCI